MIGASRFAAIKEGLGRLSARLRARNAPLILVAEGKNWILDYFSQELLARAPGQWKRGIVVNHIPYGVRGKVLHFVERYRALRSERLAELCEHNRVIIMWWHGGAYVSEQVHLAALIERVKETVALPIIYHVTSSLYIDILAEWGVPRERIVLAPMGIDLSRFSRVSPREHYKTRLGLPGDRICIGYFQRDGDEAPKLVKGPDVFVEAMARLKPHHANLLVLLAGPKRGYVMRELDRLGMAYHYAGWVPAHEMDAYYFASDFYMITSREEGGPAAVLECMATGTPLISTRVGMAVDVIHHGENGFLADVEDVDAITGHALALMGNPSLRQRISEAARETSLAYDWSIIADRYARELYDSSSEG
jgi:glycosyltransferase involved in cell wall biosynthesis